MEGVSVWVIVAVLAGAWFLQLVLSSWQMKRFYNRLHELRKYGSTATGMAGSQWRRRVYGIIAVDEQDRVVKAEVLKGWTIFAAPKPEPRLEGATVQDILDGDVAGISKKELKAFQQAAEFLQDRDSKDGDDRRDEDEQSVRNDNERRGSAHTTTDV